MEFSYLIFPISVAAINWISVIKEWFILDYITKPGTMVALLIWMYLFVPSGLGLGAWGWFALGIFLSMWGDIFLMLPQERFTAGLVSFFLAHLAYIIGLNLTLPSVSFVGLGLMIIIFVVWFRMYKRISHGLRRIGKAYLLKPLLFYMVIVGVMLLSALLTLTRPDSEWQPFAALWVSGGALLFVISDALLAWDRFVYRIPHGRLKVRVIYHLGQIGLLIGSGLHFWS